MEPSYSMIVPWFYCFCFTNNNIFGKHIPPTNLIILNSRQFHIFFQYKHINIPTHTNTIGNRGNHSYNSHVSNRVGIDFPFPFRRRTLGSLLSLGMVLSETSRASSRDLPFPFPDLESSSGMVALRM